MNEIKSDKTMLCRVDLFFVVFRLFVLLPNSTFFGIGDHATCESEIPLFFCSERDERDLEGTSDLNPTSQASDLDRLKLVKNQYF